MFNGLATKLAMKKMGIPKNALDMSALTGGSSTEPNKLKKNPPGEEDADAANANGWPKWMTVKSLPLTAQAWLNPPPPPVPVAAECPKVGDLAPLDRDRKIEFGGGRRVLVVFLRCVGCAFAQKTFLALRTLANRHQQTLTCIAVSHSSEAATKKWLDLLGGAWNVQIVVDEDRSVYAAWGLGLGNTWYLFNPTTQIQGWKEKGWLGATVATSIQRTNTLEDRVKATAPPPKKPGMMRRATGEQQRQDELPTAEMEEEGPSTVLGNKWQQAGAWAIDGRGTVVWGGKALRADDLMDLDQGAKILGL
ncbi:hypothetical protein MCOR23_011335 [Pyricularia oryzae]|uniref:Alkyl hydroperoxide reductase subunit C/ Thiol specific antioxidant domain-containing protein n=1 Tax=Pyricularia grisea TaxID=148305 RepID=A0ABQ8NMZ4_PYRGI|nr:hypothetical protein MCOR33_004677 [Pyricularia grisea]KAI6313859.1 hypothetical protein MCOR30_010135 [Pyricularia oryzae]KAI6386655.1 hypothetical protein MCOR23_011335 [Pyricularia oryzae]KAI6396163.1 hypothetical protein MCOR20_010005 [Pyricularia oryzae]KAI6422520.1 hypothetical protein MCOR22_011448 [Pyricularia oryzae]